MSARWVLLAGAACLLAGAVGAWLAQDAHWVRFFDNLHWTAGTLAAAVLGWLGVRSAAAESESGLRWIAAGLTAYAVGQLAWDLQSLFGYDGFPSPSDLFYLWLGPCVATGLLTQAWRLADCVQRKTLLLDAAILSIAVITLVLLLYLPRRGDTGSLPLAVLAAYPASLLAAVAIGLVAAPIMHPSVPRGYWPFMLSLLVTGGCWMAWNGMALEGVETSGAWFNSLFSISALGMGVGTLYWKAAALPGTRTRLRGEGMLRLLPLMAVITVVAVMAAALAVDWMFPEAGMSRTLSHAAKAGALVVIVLAMIKQGILLREHQELKTVTRHLEESERQRKMILDTIPDLVWLKDAEGIYRMCNPALSRFYGRTEAEILGRTDLDFLDAETARLFRQHDEEAMTAGHPVQNVERVPSSVNGRRLIFETIKTPVRDRNGSPLGVLGVARDITERERASQQLALVDFALNHVKEAAYLADEDGYFHYVNDEACRALDCPREELLRLRVIDVDADTTQEEQWRASWEQIRRSKSVTFESRHRNRKGRVFPVEVNANYFEFYGQAYVLGLVRDITDRKQAEQQIRDLAFFDALTRLPNRRLLMDRLGHALAASERNAEFGALMILDLDHFKTLNDTQGHDVGDRLLVEVARRLSASVRQQDSVSRLGGDEFVLLLESLGQDEQGAAAQAEAIAEKVRFAINQPYALNSGEANFHSTTSIGLTLFRGEASADLLLKQADMALYQAKDAGRNKVRFFNPSMQAAIESRTAMEAALRLALARGEFRLHYQPQVDPDGRLIGAEALLRWISPDRGVVAPAEFIPLAEETGLILPIGQWVLDTACAQAKAWARDPRTRDLQMSINVSARQFHQPDFVDAVERSLSLSGADPCKLVLELTESVVLENIDSVVSRMQQLNELGVGFCLDDFGTGYSSLSYLKRLPLDQVKIDRSFVCDVPNDPNDAAIVRAILAMSRSLGLQVIAEGVETAAQREFLLQNECTAFQGFLFCQPVPIEDLEQLLR